jgi:hypothetical protein
MALTGSISNFIIFFLITILFYSLKKNPTLDNFNTPEFYSSQNKATFIYFLVVLLTQFGFNAYILSSMCGQSSTSRSIIGQAAFFTIVPWTFFFGIVILVLYIFPNFKSAFSDVIGYYHVSDKANDILVKLLKGENTSTVNPTEMDNEGKGVDVNISETIKLTDAKPDLGAGLENKFFDLKLSPEKIPLDANIQHKIELVKKQLNLTDASGIESSNTNTNADANANELIMKICGNSGILINQMLPSNFESYWNTLSSLFVDKYKGSKSNGLKNELFDLVVTRDNIGESMWFMYTGFLVSSIVQFQIASYSCKK